MGSVRNFSEIIQKEAVGEHVKHAEQQSAILNVILDNSFDFIAAFDTSLNLIFWNTKCEERTGKQKETVLGKNVREIVTGKAGERFYVHLKKALAGEDVHCEEQPDSLEGFYKCFMTPLKYADGEIFGVLNISHDLTAKKNVTDKLGALNHALKHKNNELELLNGEMTSFSYVASHDLQEPLRKIQTFGSRIREKEFENLSPQGIEYFKRLELAAVRMQSLIDDLLAFSRTSTLPKDFEKVDLNLLLEDIKMELKEAIEENHATIQSQQLPVANIIAFQFRQLFVNILLNALKYKKAGVKHQVKITCSMVDGTQINDVHNLLPQQYYKINFIDNGIGFEQQYHTKIFELFQRLHGKSEYPGTGIGLAICKKIILNHKGAITATGHVDKGATFTVYLPV